MTHQAAQTSKPSRLFPGWHWVAVGFAFPIAGLIGWAVGGPVDAPTAALVGGAITGAGLGAAQSFAAGEMFGDARRWIATSAVAYAVGLAVAAAAVNYDTDIGSLALMGAISGAFLGAGQGLALALQGRDRLALIWGAAMPMLFSLGWWASTVIGVGVDEQFTVFGAMGAVLFTLLSGLLLARFGPSGARAA